MTKKPAPKKSGQPSSPTRPRLRRIAYWTAVAGVWGIIALAGVLAVIAWDLPDVEDAIKAVRQPVIELRAADGTVLSRRGEAYGEPIAIRDLPPALPQAILATEDRRFYDHFGIDLWAIARAAVVNIWAGGIRQGGSTLTQQAAKNLFLTPKRTFKRKAQETLLALWLEAKFSKDQIFTIYLNRVYFGDGVYGVDAAARHYFGVGARDLGNYEAAMLAAMLKGPNKYNPFKNPDLARSRTEQVLANLVVAGYMSEADVAAARAAQGDWATPPTAATGLGRHFADWVRGHVGDFMTVDRDIIITTTLDARLQRAAEKAVARLMRKGGTAEGRNVGEAALVAMTPDGRVLAMVGGKDWRHSQFNRAVQARRQPGSAFKPVVYLAGLEAGLKPASLMTDEPLSIGDWSPQNFKREHIGRVTVRDALAQSINTVAVRVSETAGRERVADVAGRLGLNGQQPLIPAMALGVEETTLLDLTAAYAVLANGGLGVWPHAIHEIRDTDGTVLYRRAASTPGRVVAGRHVEAMRAMLAHAVSADIGTGKGARLGRTQAGKTGTSQAYRDAWFIGFTPTIVAGVWLGNDDASPMDRVTGGTLPTALWRDFMTTAVVGQADRGWPAIPADDRLAEPDGPGRPKGPDLAPVITKAIEGFFEQIFGK